MLDLTPLYNKKVMGAEVCCCSLLYWLFALVVVYPPDEMVAAGVTVEGLLGSWLGSQMSRFIHYQVRRTAATLLVHSLLLPGYIFTLYKMQPWVLDWVNTKVHPSATLYLALGSLVPVVWVSVLVAYWARDNWRRHPFCRALALYSQANSSSPDAWVAVAANINTEFRRIDKFSTKASSVCRVIATDSWLIKVTSYSANVTHQRDAVLSLESSFEQPLSLNNSLDTQLLNIHVASIKDGIAPFRIRLTAMEYRELQSKIVNPVVNAREVVVHQSLSDRFIEAFTEAVNENPKVYQVEEADMCIGCMEAPANVKLQRRCGSSPDGEGRGCVTCYCRPMWCLGCLSRWFAARQDQEHPELWLSSRAPCPTCRSTFCLLDVCVISS